MTPPPPPPPPTELRLNRRGNRAVPREVALRKEMAALAARQHGVVSRRDLLEIGLSRDAIRRMVNADRLFRLHPGVYHAGHPQPTRLGAHLAATMAFGRRATGVSHRPAIALRGLVGDDGALIQVTTSSTRGGTRSGVRVHRSARLGPAELTSVQGIPTVALERALLDVAGSCSPEEFTRVFNAIDRRRLVDPIRIAGQLGHGRTGSAMLRARMDRYLGASVTESELEELFLDKVIRGHELPRPDPQRSPLPRRALRVDFAWPYPRVVVELDGRAWHAIQATWGEDHERDLALRLAGWRPLRYTFRQVVRTPGLVADDVRAALMLAA